MWTWTKQYRRNGQLNLDKKQRVTQSFKGMRMLGVAGENAESKPDSTWPLPCLKKDKQDEDN